MLENKYSPVCDTLQFLYQCCITDQHRVNQPLSHIFCPSKAEQVEEFVSRFSAIWRLGS